MIEKVKAYIIQEHLLSSKETVVVAVSGGADSVALLNCLHKLQYNIIVAHCNFQLRGAESDGDEKFVVELSEKLHLPCETFHFDTKEYADTKGISIQMAARDLRYSWFREVAKKHECKKIAVAHHIDDQIETFFINLYRGTGLGGLKGMLPQNDTIIRPFLCISKEEILNYITTNNISYHEDSSNSTNHYLRNKIRNIILPVLKTELPGIEKKIASIMPKLQDSYTFIQYYISSLKITEKRDGVIFFNIKKIQSSPSPNTVVFELLHPYGFKGDVIQNICDSFSKQSGKKYFSETHILIKDRDSLLLSKREESNESNYYVEKNTLLIHEPISLQFETIPAFRFEKIGDHTIIQIDADKVSYPLIIRRWKNGDYFHPFGLNGTKKISDYFTDEKLTILEKKQIWLLCSGENIIWIIGKRLDNHFRITETTTSILKIVKLAD